MGCKEIVKFTKELADELIKENNKGMTHFEEDPNKLISDDKVSVE